MLCRYCTCPESSEKTEWILSISRLAWSNQNTLVASKTSNKEQTSAKCHRTRILRLFFSSSLATWPVIASKHSTRLLGVLHLITPNRAILNWNDGENPGTRSQANRWEPVINFHLRWVGKGVRRILGSITWFSREQKGHQSSLTEYKKRKYRALNANKGDHSNTIEGLALKILRPIF